MSFTISNLLHPGGISSSFTYNFRYAITQTEIFQLPPNIYLTKLPLHFHMKNKSEIFRRAREYRTHYFTREDAEAVIEHETYLDRKTAFQIAFDTGARAGEITQISAEHFDFEREQMMLWDSKKKTWKIVPLSQKTLIMVKTYLNSTKIRTKLFKVTTKTLNNWLKERCKTIDIKPDPGLILRWHTWRGTFIRTHKSLGDKWLMQVTGDNYITLLKYYEEMTDSDLRAAKRTLGNE